MKLLTKTMLPPRGMKLADRGDLGTLFKYSNVSIQNIYRIKVKRSGIPHRFPDDLRLAMPQLFKKYEKYDVKGSAFDDEIALMNINGGGDGDKPKAEQVIKTPIAIQQIVYRVRRPEEDEEIVIVEDNFSFDQDW